MNSTRNSTGRSFVIKHTFMDVKRMKTGGLFRSNTENHHNLPWSLSIYKGKIEDAYSTKICLKCEKSPETPWRISANITSPTWNPNFCKLESSGYFTDQFHHLWALISSRNVKNYLIDGNLTVECHVEIKSSFGVTFENMKNFDYKTMKDSYDVTLKVKDQKFYVNKMSLVSRSSYFEAMFMRGFQESNQSEIEINDIEPLDFQKFLEVIYAEPAIKDDNVDGILKVADFFNSKRAIKRCENFLIHMSKKSLKRKLQAANEYVLTDLKKNCLTEIKKDCRDMPILVPYQTDNVE